VVSSASAGGASSSSEWFNRSLRCCAEDDHVSLGATWAQNFGNCPLDDSQWGKLFATAAAHGALGCLEFLFQVWRCLYILKLLTATSIFFLILVLATYAFLYNFACAILHSLFKSCFFKFLSSSVWIRKPVH